MIAEKSSEGFVIVVSTGDVEWSTDGLAMASRNCLISGMGSMLERSEERRVGKEC